MPLSLNSYSFITACGTVRSDRITRETESAAIQQQKIQCDPVLTKNFSEQNPEILDEKVCLVNSSIPFTEPALNCGEDRYVKLLIQNFSTRWQLAKYLLDSL